MTLNKKRFLLVLLCCCVAVFWAFSAQATIWSASNDSSLYGKANQLNVTPAELGYMSCGPTSAANSLLYLQQAFPTAYGTNLVPDSNADGTINSTDALAVAQILTGSTYMDTSTAYGTYWTDFGTAIKKYTEEKAPSLTAYASATGSSLTWNWIYNQLDAGSDLEILIQKIVTGTSATGANHFITIYGLTWDDVQNSGTISYVDPWGGVLGAASIDYSSSRYEINYMGGSWIYGGESQGPISIPPAVPEPSTLILLGTGMLGLALRLRKR